MKGKLFLVTVLLAAAVFLCGAAQAEIRVNEFPGFDAIPEHFDLLADEMPPLPSAEIDSDGTITVTGLKAWGIDQEMMSDWQWTDWGELYPVSSETYDDKMVIRVKGRESNEYIGFPVLETENCPAEMLFFVGNDFYSDDPSKGKVTVEFRYKADGTNATRNPDGAVTIEKDDGQAILSVYYSESGDFLSAMETRRLSDGFGRYELVRVTDCLTGEQFDEITVTGEVEPDAMQIRMAGEAIPQRIRIQAGDKYAFKEGEPALPVLDPLPENALPEVWPAEYPDAFPAFSCEVKDGKTIWTVESLTGWGARVNIPGETYLTDYENNNTTINYFWRSYTMDEVPGDRFRIVSEAPDGFFHTSVETERGPYRMELEGQAISDSKENPAPWLWLGLIINENRNIEVGYFSDGTTVRKQISMPVDGEIVTGVYGEDNRLQ